MKTNRAFNELLLDNVGIKIMKEVILQLINLKIGIKSFPITKYSSFVIEI